MLMAAPVRVVAPRDQPDLQTSERCCVPATDLYANASGIRLVSRFSVIFSSAEGSRSCASSESSICGQAFVIQLGPCNNRTCSRQLAASCKAKCRCIARPPLCRGPTQGLRSKCERHRQ